MISSILIGIAIMAVLILFIAFMEEYGGIFGIILFILIVFIIVKLLVVNDYSLPNPF